jgi:hypothetical protein
MLTNFWPEKLKENITENPGAEARLVVKFKVYKMGGVDWIYLAQDRDLWRALVNAAMNH